MKTRRARSLTPWDFLLAEKGYDKVEIADTNLEGVDLLAWIEIESLKPLQVTIARE
ncbi:MAG: hypothetical protein MUC91_08260 [Verrucomicrobia bacterium]|nr:hypothetical protein [Verrucomicrobiota bacterium]